MLAVTQPQEIMATVLIAPVALGRALEIAENPVFTAIPITISQSAIILIRLFGLRIKYLRIEYLRLFKIS